ncbi:MAG: polyhydroxyalkanoate synthesis regulator DNA-binding domain-containing protein [Anaerolineales bacterium]|jgi:polyhydroxyalkanoate synthesis repressor PhaR
MPVIKRYPNRKLYNTESKQYITLEGISKLIRQGDEIRVVDHASGEDLTTVTLTQIIFELEKKQSGFLPRSILSGLIQAGGERIGAIQRTLASTLGINQLVDEEIRERLHALVEEAELTENEARQLLVKLVSSRFRSPEDTHLWQFFELPPAQELERILSERQVPTRSDLQKLLNQLDVLTAKIEQIENREV